MMNKIGKINYREIRRISPSQFYSMKDCAYKSLLAEAFEKKPLLPVSPNAYLGIVLHKMLELIAKGAVTNEDDFNRMFNEQIRIIEDKLQKDGYGFFIPLQKNVKDFGLRVVLLKKHLRSNSALSMTQIDIQFYSERWFESKDRLIAGKIDLVIETGENTEIVDFKTGAITEDVLDDGGEVFVAVREEYKDQLKLYAYLYFENTGKFPAYLSLVDLAKQKFAINFSEAECYAVYEKAKELLYVTNECVRNGTFTANTTEANCKYCLYRPACSFFQQKLETDYSFNDVSGSVKDTVRYQNGNVSVFLQSGKECLAITGFESDRYEELKNAKSKRIYIYNLRKEATKFVYSATKTTMIYE